MVRAAARSRAELLLTLLGIVVAFSACAPTFGKDIYWQSRFGLRPDEPLIKAEALKTAASSPGASTADGSACKEFDTYAEYTKNLKEAYRTRTTQNRTWIYVAGITGLAVAAASGALAAATAVAAGTLALLAISGGVTAASFATIDNPALANVYNEAANDIGTALATAEARVVKDPTDANCARRLSALIRAVSDARNELETARTNSAAGALARAMAERRGLDRIIAGAGGSSTTGTTLVGEITKLNGKAGELEITIGEADTEVTLTVINAPLENAVPRGIKVAIGSKDLDVVGFPVKKGSEYELKVMVPGMQPDKGKDKYEPFLLVGDKTISPAEGIQIVYKKKPSS